MGKVSRHDIARAVVHMLAEGQDERAVVAALASYLVAERRTRELDALVRDIETIRYRQDGILEATVQSARELDESVKETIKQLMDARQVYLHHRLKPDIVGGVTVHALDKQLDLSIRSKLKKLKQLTTVKD